MIKIKFTERQAEAYKLLMGDETTEVAYGGAAFSGKSVLGVLWIATQCIANPNTTYLIGRRELSNLKKTTLMTFFKMMNEAGVPSDEYELNNQSNIIHFSNGSKIFLMALGHMPSDPEYLRLGGLELAGAFVDEANECEEKAIQILLTRLGRSGVEHGLKPKLLLTFNPSKNWIYSRYYLPYKKKTENKGRRFIPALPTDNPYTTEDYLEVLRNSDEITKQRLLYGNFDYSDDERNLISYDKIVDIFTNSFVTNGRRYITCDIALQGRDNFVIANWDGLRCTFSVIEDKSKPSHIETEIKKQLELNKTPRSGCVVDSDGVGAYVSDYVKNIKEFHGGSKTIRDGYKNLKTDCAYKLAELINKGEIFISNADKQITIGSKQMTVREALSEELGQLMRDNIDKDESKKQIISKDEMKRNIGRSPDLLDTLLMRMVFELEPERTVTVRAG